MEDDRLGFWDVVLMVFATPFVAALCVILFVVMLVFIVFGGIFTLICNTIDAIFGTNILN